MAKKLYEEENIRYIAETIRDMTGESRTYTTAEMAGGVETVHAIAYETGLKDGAESITVGQLNTIDDIRVDVDESSVNINVPSGYYAEEIMLSPNVDPIYDKGYDDGLAIGGGGSTLEQDVLIDQSIGIPLIIDLNEYSNWYVDYWESQFAFPADTDEVFGQYGRFFVDLVEYELSDPYSNPVTVTFYNYTNLSARVAYSISDNAVQEYWYWGVVIPPNESVSQTFESEASRGSDWRIRIIGAYFAYCL